MSHERSSSLKKSFDSKRTEASSIHFQHMIKKHGGIPVEIPVFSVSARSNNEKEMENVMLSMTYDWIIFTSNVTVDTFFSFMAKRVKYQLSTFPKISCDW